MLIMVAPVAVEASVAVTSVHASTLPISFAFGVGVGDGLGDVAEDVPDDPHATRAIKAPVIIAMRASLTSGVSQGDDAVSRFNSPLLRR
jgi:hypothetical protein